MMTSVSPWGYELSYKKKYPSEVDWGPDRRPQKRARYSTTTRWQCGNPKKRKELVEHFGEVSSAHGTVYICSGRKVSMCSRIFYRILFTICFLCVVLNIISLVQEALSSESSYMNNINKVTSIGREEDPKYFPGYPRITVCRKPPYRTDFNTSYQELVEYATLSLGFPFSVWTPEEMAHLLNIHYHGKSEDFLSNYPDAAHFYAHLQKLEKRYLDLKNSQTDFDVKEFIEEHSIRCEEFFLNCQAMMFSFNCCNLFRPVLTSIGLCYTLNNTKQIEQLMIDIPIDFAFNLDLTSPPAIDKVSEVGFQVFLTDPHEDTYVFEPFEGQKIVPGLVTTITVQLMKRDRTALYTPWHGLSTTCPKLHFGEGYERFTPRTCETYFIYETLREACQCDSVLSQGYSSEQRFCDPVDQYECFMTASLRSNLTDMAEVCHDPCILYSFKNDASYIGLGGHNISRVEIMYNSKQFIFHEFRTFTMSGLFSQIGGALGLYLGASIITVVEMATFLLSWLWYTWIPSKTSFSRVQQAPNQPYTFR